MSTYHADPEYGVRPPHIDMIDGQLSSGFFNLGETRIAIANDVHGCQNFDQKECE